jgi:cell wall-associated NlpC family hydrolase
VRISTAVASSGMRSAYRHVTADARASLAAMPSLRRKANFACAGVAALAALAGCGSTGTGSGGHASQQPARPPAASAGVPAVLVGSAGSAGHGVVKQVRDPQEASSFPVAGAVHHAAAATPAKAGEAVVAAGAPSDAEVKRELAQMQAVEREAKRTQQLRLTPVAGGRSIGGNGTVPIPSAVPEVVQKVIAGANEIADFPYVFGGGHASFVDNAYDCSGSVSYALAAGGLLSTPETSGELESWGAPGPGRYITVLAAAGHTYMYVNGVMYNTAGRSGTYASRWQVGQADSAGFVVRHWPGL